MPYPGATPVTPVDKQGNVIGGSGGGASSQTVQGSGPSGSATSGNPVLVAGSDGTNSRTVATDTGGRVQVVPYVGAVAVAALPDNVDGVAASSTVNGIKVQARNTYFDGTNWARARGDTAGGYMVNVPSAAAAVAITPVVAVGVSALVVKASAGNFYSASVTNNTTAGFLIVYNAAAAPAGGTALTANLILAAVPVAASGYGSIDLAAIPDRASAGITLLFSTSTTTYTVPAALPLHIRGRAS